MKRLNKYNNIRFITYYTYLYINCRRNYSFFFRNYYWLVAFNNFDLIRLKLKRHGVIKKKQYYLYYWVFCRVAYEDRKMTAAIWFRISLPAACLYSFVRLELLKYKAIVNIIEIVIIYIHIMSWYYWYITIINYIQICKRFISNNNRENNITVQWTFYRGVL